MPEVRGERIVAGGGFARLATATVASPGAPITAVGTTIDIVTVSDERFVKANTRSAAEFYEIQLTNEVMLKTSKIKQTRDFVSLAEVAEGSNTDKFTFKCVVDETNKGLIRGMYDSGEPVIVVFGDGRIVRDRTISKYGHLLGYLEGDFETAFMPEINQYDIAVAGGETFSTSGLNVTAYNTALTGAGNQITPDGGSAETITAITQTELDLMTGGKGAFK